MDIQEDMNEMIIRDTPDFFIEKEEISSGESPYQENCSWVPGCHELSSSNLFRPITPPPHPLVTECELGLKYRLLNITDVKLFEDVPYEFENLNHGEKLDRLALIGSKLLMSSDLLPPPPATDEENKENKVQPAIIRKQTIHPYPNIIVSMIDSQGLERASSSKTKSGRRIPLPLPSILRKRTKSKRYRRRKMMMTKTLSVGGGCGGLGGLHYAGIRVGGQKGIEFIQK